MKKNGDNLFLESESDICLLGFCYMSVVSLIVNVLLVAYIFAVKTGVL